MAIVSPESFPLPSARAHEDLLRPSQSLGPANARLGDGVPPFATLVSALGREAERGEIMVRGVLAGSRAGPAISSRELLALQAGIYRYGETIDLAAKLVDKAGTDVRTVLSGQT
jgi:hypothetical protein